MLSAHVSDLIALIYRGAHDPVSWKAALDGLISITGSRFTMASTVDLGKSRYSSSHFHGADDALFLDGVQDYKDYKYQTDPTLAFAKANPEAGFVTLTMALDAIGERHADSAYAAWTRDSLGVGVSMVCYTQYRKDYILGVSLHPSTARGVHSESDIRLFQMLFRHIELSVQMNLDPINLDTTADAIILLTGDGLISAKSNEAGRLLALNDGIGTKGGRLSFSDPRDETRFGALLRSACATLQEGGTGGTTKIARPSEKIPWIVSVSPMPRPPASFKALRPAAVVRLISVSPPRIEPISHDVAQLLGLTRAEANVAGHLKRGSNDTAIAGHLNVGVSTIRSHVKAILGKADVRTKAELAYLLTVLRPGD